VSTDANYRDSHDVSVRKTSRSRIFAVEITTAYATREVEIATAYATREVEIATAYATREVEIATAYATDYENQNSRSRENC
jgi:hypothetical protein